MFQHLQDTWFLNVNAFAQHTPALQTPMRLYAQFGVVLFAGLLLLGWWLARRGGGPATMAAALWAPVGALVALALNQPLGRLVAEKRPYAVLPHVQVLVARTHDFSFPSDHAVMAGAVAAGVLLTDRRLGWFTVVAAVALAFSRVYVGAHFPLDVVAGLLVGAGVTLLCFVAVRPLATRLVVALSGSPLRPLLLSHGANPTAGGPM